MDAASPLPDPRPFYERAADQMAALIDLATKDTLDRQTPCTEYDVQGLVSHVIAGTRRFVTVGEHGAAPAAADDAPDVPGDGLAEAYATERRKLAAAWADDAKLDTEVTVPWGTMPGRYALSGSVMETVTHAWDLSRTLGHPIPLDQELAAFALGTARQALPAEGREGLPFGPVVPVDPAETDAYVQLAGWLGRTP
ncbi:TIGR03086 family metal-binding protein [Streptomyces coffeae]|uniref:TIGR03086 family protein n=1 Tax=Streptomyces coffeae TaxID=621382 RepID=A0ABS1NMW4_9ACTN|nr:TIGR03086 family metal-binding protein [Streptomyces coffeae]MBL1101434.1 TIGR03086 family protein [Streptomyces coffeae]